MTPTYRIRNWADHFESYEQTRLKARDGLKWVAITTKHDGKTFRRLASLPGAASIYGAWVLIVAVAGKCPVRGVLADSDGPLTAEDLEIKTGFPQGVFQQALDTLSSDRFLWLEIVDPRESTGIPAGQRESPPTIHHPTPQDITIQDPTPQEPGGGSKRRFRIWKNATREEILSPSGAQRVFELATGAGICTVDERQHMFRLICSLSEANGNLPGILTAILRGSGTDPWRARGGEFEQQARDWIRQLDVPPAMQQRNSDLSTGPPDKQAQIDALKKRFPRL